MVSVEHAVTLSAVLFTIGLVGAVTRRNLIVIVVSIELMLGAVCLAFISFNRLWAATESGAARAEGQVFALMVIVVGASQLALALGVVVAGVRKRDSLNVDDASELKW